MDTSNQTGSQYGGIKQVLAVSIGLFIVFLDSTIVNIALPAVMEDYQIGLETATWIINSFVITLAVLLVTMGKMADIFGSARFYKLGLILFMISSFLCGIAPTPESLIVFRILQGLSGAMVIPTSMILVRAAVPQEKMGLAMGIWGAVGALAVAIGPSVGGVITEYINWRWIFYINIPVIVIALPFIYWNFRKTKDTRKAFQFDPLGILTLSIGLFLLTYAILKGQDLGWSSLNIVLLFSTSILSFVLFFIVENKVKNPLLDFEILRNRAYISGILANLLSGAILMGTMIILPVFLTQVQGFSTLEASFIITPLSAIMLIVAPLIGRLIDRVGYILPMLIGYAFSIAGFYLLSTISTDTSVSYLVWMIAIAGVGIGCIMVTSVTVCTSVVSEKQVSLASGIFAMVRNLGGAIGVALFVSITLTNLSGYSANVVEEGISKFAAAEIPAEVQAEAIQRLREREEQIFDPNSSVESFQINPAQIDQLIDLKVKEAELQLPEGVALPDEMRLAIETAVHEESSKIEEQVNDIQSEIKVIAEQYSTQAISYAFLCGLILCLGFLPTILLLNRKRSRNIAVSGANK